MVALVGIDGSGKTTQAHRLAAALTAAGVPASYRQNAGGRRFLSRLAARLPFARYARRADRPDAHRLLGRRGTLLAESVLRWLAICRGLLWSLAAGRIAVMDRYSYCQYVSLRAHGVAGGRMTLGERVARLAYGVFPRPAVTFLLDVDPREAWRRVEARGTDHERIVDLAAGAAAYRALPEAAGFTVIDANQAPDAVADALLAALTARVSAGTRPPGEGAAAVTALGAFPALW